MYIYIYIYIYIYLTTKYVLDQNGYRMFRCFLFAQLNALIFMEIAMLRVLKKTPLSLLMFIYLFVFSNTVTLMAKR